MKALSKRWELDTFFPGGSSSTEFRTFLDELDQGIDELQAQISALKTAAETNPAAVKPVINRLQQLTNELIEAQSFTGCLGAQDVKDQAARKLNGRVTQLSAAFQSLLTALEEWLIAIPDEQWHDALQDPELHAIAFPLEERRRLAREKMSPELESLVNDLAVDGYHGWSELYDTIVGRIAIPVEEEGAQTTLSVGQAFNRLSHSDPHVRAEMFAKWEDAWADAAELCAAALNHMAGFRLALYSHRKWDSVLKEPLDINRMSAETLQTIWNVIEQNKAPFVQYLQRKAGLLKMEKLGWQDVAAPLSQTNKTFTYEEAGEFIVKQFHQFSPDLANFAEQAIENRWIEAEDRPGKRPGGFCTAFPLNKQSRIFMTFSGTTDNVSTLAHELGHAYHQHVMDELPPLAQNYAMNVAETASTFAELIVIDAAIQNAADPAEHLALLDEKIQSSISFYMNIHARFLFETSFYEQRKEGLISTDELNELMLTAQKKAYHDSLGSYHSLFWASKLHFYITDIPFYNFPYTFGYLFSSGIYARARQEGARFADKYVELLQDTASMTVEQLAEKHLGVDLTRSEFWQSAIDLTLQDVNAFLRLTEGM
ncbi:MAG: oligoendopeptidase pepF/M3 family [Bacilli bacterium]|nr:oligoendopeptidase pepF/M3 family [Bacilli bacterium]